MFRAFVYTTLAALAALVFAVLLRLDLKSFALLAIGTAALLGIAGEALHNLSIKKVTTLQDLIGRHIYRSK